MRERVGWLKVSGSGSKSDMDVCAVHKSSVRCVGVDCFVAVVVVVVLLLLLFGLVGVGVGLVGLLCRVRFMQGRRYMSSRGWLRPGRGLCDVCRINCSTIRVGCIWWLFLSRCA